MCVRVCVPAMVKALLLVGAVPFGLLDASTLDPALGLPGAGYTHASDGTFDMNWRALLHRLGTPQLPDVVLSSSQHHPHHHDEGKPDILLPESPLSTTVAANGEPSEVKVEVPSSSSSSPSQEAMKTRGSESRLPLIHWLREALSVLKHKRGQEEEREEVEETGVAAGRDEWREAGVLLRKIGDLLDGYTWSGRGRATPAALRLPHTRPLACCCCCCLAASIVGLLTWRLLLWCR